MSRSWNPCRIPYIAIPVTFLMNAENPLRFCTSAMSIHWHAFISREQGRMSKVKGRKRHKIKMSDLPKAPGCLCCCLRANMDRNSTVQTQTSYLLLSYLLHVGRKWKGGIVSDCSFLGTVNEVYITCTGA